jgi:iron(III) transport system permease protein
MQSNGQQNVAAFRRLPGSLYVVSLILFCATAIVPVAWMLGQFLVSAAKDPRSLSTVLLDSRQLILLGRSLGIAASAAGVAVLVGLPVAVILAATDLPLRRFFTFLVLIPMLIPSYVMAGAWLHLLSPHGTVNQTLATWFGPSAMLRIQSVPGCIWCLGVSFFPLIALIVSTGILQLDTTLQDAARLCMGRWGVFWHSTMPQLRPHLAAAICLALVFILAQYGVPSLLGVNTYPVEIFAQFSAFYDEAAAVGTCLPLVAIVVLLVLFQQRVMGLREHVSVTPRSDSGRPVTLGRMKPWAAAWLLVLFAITTVLPMASVLVRANGLKGAQSTISIFKDALLFTALLAFVAAVACTVIAFFLAHWLAHGTGWAVKTLNVVCWLPMAIPGTVVGLGFIRAANAMPSARRMDSFGLFLLLAYIGMFCAFPIRILHAAYKGADPNVDEAAALDCPHWYQRCWHIDAKIHAGAIAVSIVLVFVLAAGELNATVLLSPPGKDTLSVSIDNLLHYGASATASAFCLIEAALVLLAGGTCVVVMRILQRLSAGGVGSMGKTWLA